MLIITQRERKSEREERKRRERVSIHSLTFDTGAWGKKECWVPSVRNNDISWMKASTEKLGGKLYFQEKKEFGNLTQAQTNAFTC